MAREFVNTATSALFPVNYIGTTTGFFFLVFGGLHCIAWKGPFPSLWKSWAWRDSSLVLATSVPISWLLGMATSWVAQHLFKDREEFTNNPFVTVPSWVGKWFNMSPGNTVLFPLSEFVHGLGLGLYILARIYLLVEVFFGLRSLPAACYMSVDWSKIIPHL